jgi:hypothetical protein
MEMTEPALIALAAGNGGVYHNHIPRLELRYLTPHICHDRTALMADTEWKLHDLIPDPSLRVIVEIGSADPYTEDPEQYVSWMLQRGDGLVHYLDLPNACQYHSFHTFPRWRNPGGIEFTSKAQRLEVSLGLRGF